MQDAFPTGSRCYGQPRTDSDVDLVIRVTPETVLWLAKHLGGGTGVPMDLKFKKYGNGSLSIRAGNLNLVCCLTDAVYQAWKSGTETLKAEQAQGKTITKERACAILDHLVEVAQEYDDAMGLDWDFPEEIKATLPKPSEHKWPTPPPANEQWSGQGIRFDYTKDSPF